MAKALKEASVLHCDSDRWYGSSHRCQAIELRSKDRTTQSSVAAGDLNTATVTHCAAPAVSSQPSGARVLDQVMSEPVDTWLSGGPHLQGLASLDRNWWSGLQNG